MASPDALAGALEFATVPWLYLSAYFERHRQTYYDLLMAVSPRGEWRDWLHSLFESPLLTIPMAQELLSGMSHSALRNMGKPVQAGIVRQVGERAYGKVFIAERILQVMQGRNA